LQQTSKRRRESSSSKKTADVEKKEAVLTVLDVKKEVLKKGVLTAGRDDVPDDSVTPAARVIRPFPSAQVMQIIWGEPAADEDVIGYEVDELTFCVDTSVMEMQSNLMDDTNNCRRHLKRMLRDGALDEASEKTIARFRDDAVFARELILRDPHCLNLFSAKLRGDKELVMLALTERASALQYATEDLKADKEFVMTAVLRKAKALGHAANGFGADREVVMHAAKKSGVVALQMCAPPLKADREIVMAAVKQCGDALKFADDSLRRDRVFVANAMQVDVNSLWAAAEELRDDPHACTMVGLSRRAARKEARSHL